MPELPAGLKPVPLPGRRLIDSLYLDLPSPTDGRKPKRIPLNEANFAKKEFQELWGRINHKAVYQVEFDSAELIEQVHHRARQAPHGRRAPVRRPRRAAERDALDADDLASGDGLRGPSSTTTHTETATASSQVTYDLLGEITEKTQLTRRTARAILQGVQPGTFAKFRQNPEQFITEAARLINEQKATVIVEHLTYDTLDDRYDTAIFTENQTKQDFTKAGDKLKKHIYDYVVTDSKVERHFVTRARHEHGGRRLRQAAARLLHPDARRRLQP